MSMTISPLGTYLNVRSLVAAAASAEPARKPGLPPSPAPTTMGSDVRRPATPGVPSGPATPPGAPVPLVPAPAPTRPMPEPLPPSGMPPGAPAPGMPAPRPQADPSAPVLPEGDRPTLTNGPAAGLPEAVKAPVAEIGETGNGLLDTVAAKVGGSGPGQLIATVGGGVLGYGLLMKGRTSPPFLAAVAALGAGALAGRWLYNRFFASRV